VSVLPKREISYGYGLRVRGPHSEPTSATDRLDPFRWAPAALSDTAQPTAQPSPGHSQPAARLLLSSSIRPSPQPLTRSPAPAAPRLHLPRFGPTSPSPPPLRRRRGRTTMAALLARQAAQALRARQTVRIPSPFRPCPALPESRSPLSARGFSDREPRHSWVLPLRMRV